VWVCTSRSGAGPAAPASSRWAVRAAACRCWIVLRIDKLLMCAVQRTHACAVVADGHIKERGLGDRGQRNGSSGSSVCSSDAASERHPPRAPVAVTGAAGGNVMGSAGYTHCS